MSKARIFLFLGIWVMILPYLGFPSAWKDFLFTVSGLVLIYFSYALHKTKIKEEQKKTFDNFRENNDFKENKAETTAPEESEHAN